MCYIHQLPFHLESSRGSFIIITDVFNHNIASTGKTWYFHGDVRWYQTTLEITPDERHTASFYWWNKVLCGYQHIWMQMASKFMYPSFTLCRFTVRWLCGLCLVAYLWKLSTHHPAPLPPCSITLLRCPGFEPRFVLTQPAVLHPSCWDHVWYRMWDPICVRTELLAPAGVNIWEMLRQNRREKNWWRHIFGGSLHCFSSEWNHTVSLYRCDFPSLYQHWNRHKKVDKSPEMFQNTWISCNFTWWLSFPFYLQVTSNATTWF